MIRFLFLFCFFAFVSTAWALALHDLPESVQKGATLLVSGECTQPVWLEFEWNHKTVFEQNADCNNGVFSDTVLVSFLFPSGETTVFASEGTQTVFKKTLVVASRESAFLAISLLSPVQQTLARGETALIRVLVLDDQTPLDSVNVLAWDTKNNVLKFESKGNGVFESHMQVPLDAPLGEWRLTILAQTSDENIQGGEQTFVVPIARARIQVQVVSLEQSSFSTAEPVPVRFNARYENGLPVENPKVTLFVGENELALTESNGYFEAVIPVSTERPGLQKITILVSDAFQNSVTKEIQVSFVSDFKATLFEWLPILLVSLLLIAIVAYRVIPAIRQKKSLKTMQKRRLQIDSELATLQKDYFENNSVSKEFFDQKTGELTAESEELDKKLNNQKTKGL